MSKRKQVAIDNIGIEIGRQLAEYREDLQKRVNAQAEHFARRLVKRTKATAPKGKRRPHYRSKIAYMETAKALGKKVYTWYVKGKDYRLTHLLVHGHATKNGGRSKADPFLQNAVNEVIPEFEKAVEEECKRG